MHAIASLWGIATKYLLYNTGKTIGSIDTKTENQQILFRNVGTRMEPMYDKPELVEVDDVDDPFGYRQHIIVVDWNEDGLNDVLTLDKDRQYTYYERYQAQDGLLHLRFGYNLRYEDGAVITQVSIHPWDNYLCACDWDGDGDWDLLVGIGQRMGIVFLENVGDLKQPVFRRPRRILANGKPITHSTHCMRPFAVDWDNTGKLDILSGSESGWLHLFRRAILSIEQEEC